PLVKTDPTAFYDYEAYDAGAKMLYQTVKLRAESIRGQVDGVIPSTDEGQKADSSALVDASSIDIKTMGEFGMGEFGEAMGGPGMGVPGGFGGNAGPAEGGIIERNDEAENSDDHPQDTAMAFAGPPVNMFEGGMPGFGEFPGGQEGNRDGFPGMNQGATEEQRKKNLILFGISLLIMLAALFFTKCWRRPKWTK
ncbi:MAG: hypothetical protein J6Z35_10835, partial [Lachnospiraceae bacterium]|nr:hypothetical protein [Lachnospiraceae bacterium]